MSPDFQAPQETEELCDNHPQNTIRLVFRKATGFWKLPEIYLVVPQICCSFLKLESIALMEYAHFLSSFSRVRQFLGLLSFLKGHQLYFDSRVSSKSNHLSEGNLEKQNLSQVRAWLTKFYDRKCFQAKTSRSVQRFSKTASS